RSGRRRYSAAAGSKAFAAIPERQATPRRLSGGIEHSHMAMVPEKGSKGNLDPSRTGGAPVAPGAADTRVAGRDDPAGLPDSADAGSWHRGAAGDARRHGRHGCNSAVPDHNAGRSRTPHDI